MNQKYFEKGLHEPLLYQENPILKLAVKWLQAYFSGEKPCFSDLPLDLSGTAFQKKVWKELQTISYAQTMTYGQVAEKLGVKSAQAIGGAVARNPAAIVVPCHRVLGSQGQLTGYAGGLEKKIGLLKHEGIRFNDCRP
ncbi:methylated DNA-protein cysteine methyltransferase [Streptococcus macacae NCTC 11558]|uniref:methylated-DNA--[protein]-cysteine S-methyltransferase n=1 Tax=Streptococcus macacae NCTC 11558 TaxID=764298 RepID=G5JYE8_9STRE|nr:methylated-DNA-[protein]-cysteine S-methyltransferase, DNA-binding domain protein [Streptococcus macacae NCTC 11558]SUN78061.1 methylated DNA-protein cysteine methyltransferase [Streptococcus macacae NCTC 11558]